jgi:hypothetical protein
MSSSQRSEVYQSSFLRILMPLIVSDWFSMALEGWRIIRRLLSRRTQEGMYEILDYDSVLEIQDPRGEVAVFKRRQKVRFLQDNIIAYQDFAWGDGNILADYRCSPGVPVDQYQDGYRHNILISLRETKNKGDVVDFNIERKVTGGFTKPNEWRQVMLEHKTRKLRIAVIFPKDRPCQRATLTERNINRTTALGEDHFNLLPDGRQMLSWETARPRLFELYTIKWRW